MRCHMKAMQLRIFLQFCSVASYKNKWTSFIIWDVCFHTCFCCCSCSHVSIGMHSAWLQICGCHTFLTAGCREIRMSCCFKNLSVELHRYSFRPPETNEIWQQTAPLFQAWTCQPIRTRKGTRKYFSWRWAVRTGSAPSGLLLGNTGHWRQLEDCSALLPPSNTETLTSDYMSQFNSCIAILCIW